MASSQGVEQIFISKVVQCCLTLRFRALSHWDNFAQSLMGPFALPEACPSA